MPLEDLPLVTALQVALALKAMTTAYKLVKKYQREDAKRNSGKRKAMPYKNSRRYRR